MNPSSRTRTVASSHRLVQVCLLLIGCLASPAFGQDPDPDRMLAQPTGWTYWYSHTSTDLKYVNPEVERLSDIELIDNQPFLYDEVRVANRGKFERFDQVFHEDLGVYDTAVELTQDNLRITDLEISRAASPPYFTFLAVPNDGVAEKEWDLQWDMEAASVRPHLDKLLMRPTDIESYVANGKRLYAFTAIRNQGEDKRDWRWFASISAADLGAELSRSGMRLLDIDNIGPDRFTAIAIDNSEGAYWWWGVGVSSQQIGKAIAMTNSRLIDLESYVERDVAKHAFISLDNANRESRRLWNLSQRLFDDPAFGNNEIRGLYVKRVEGPVIADVAGHYPFQPMSVLKLLPYLYAWMEIDAGNASLDQTWVSWEQALNDNPATVNFDETIDANCLVGTSIPYGFGMSPWAPALQTMMWESHNRTLDAFLNAFTPTAITARMQQIGMNQTVMHFGCDQPNDPAPWWRNRSTLADISWLYESVDTLQSVTKPSSREGFMSHMIEIHSSGPSYTSPITGRTSGGWGNTTQFLLPIIQQEAGANQAAVLPFLSEVRIRSKGGGLGSGSPEFGYSFAHHVTLPFKQGNSISPQSFTIGAFVYGMTEPPGCPDTSTAPQCKALWDAEWADWRTFVAELYRVPIRQALATW